MPSKRSAVKPSECGHIAKESHRSITLEIKLELICRREDGQTGPNVCRSMKLSPSTVITENADKVKQSKEHATTVSATQVSYSRSKSLNNGETVVIRAGRLK